MSAESVNRELEQFLNLPEEAQKHLLSVVHNEGFPTYIEYVLAKEVWSATLVSQVKGSLNDIVPPGYDSWTEVM